MPRNLRLKVLLLLLLLLQDITDHICSTRRTCHGLTSSATMNGFIFFVYFREPNVNGMSRKRCHSVMEQGM